MISVNDITAEIIELNEVAHTAVVRFLAPGLTEEDLEPQRGPNGAILRREEDGRCLRIATDVNLAVPAPIPEDWDLQKSIAGSLPAMARLLDTYLKVKTPTIDTSMGKLKVAFPNARVVKHYVPPPPPAPTPAPTPAPQDISTQVINAVQARLDGLARSFGYDNIVSACSYATSENPKFQREGKFCMMQRDAHWSKCYELMAYYQTEGIVPLLEDVMSQMPSLGNHGL